MLIQNACFCWVVKDPKSIRCSWAINSLKSTEKTVNKRFCIVEEVKRLVGSCAYLSFFSKGTELEDLMHLGSMELAVNLTKFLYGPISLGIESSKSNTP